MFRPDALVFFRAKLDVSTRAFNFLSTHKPSLGVTRSHALPPEVAVRSPVDCALTALQCGHPTLGNSLPPSLLRRSPAGVLWMWMASFSRSSSGRLVDHRGVLPVDGMVALPSERVVASCTGGTPKIAQALRNCSGAHSSAGQTHTASAPSPSVRLVTSHS